MIDLRVGVSDDDRVKAFYTEILTPLVRSLSRK